MNYPQGYYDPAVLAERLGLSRDAVAAEMSVELVVALNRILDMIDGLGARIARLETLAAERNARER